MIATALHRLLHREVVVEHLPHQRQLVAPTGQEIRENLPRYRLQQYRYIKPL
jgi:hypothetical protein